MLHPTSLLQTLTFDFTFIACRLIQLSAFQFRRHIILHDKMLKEGSIPNDGCIQDSTVFFRTCPFVRSGLGCTLPPRCRAYVCNFFICREVLENPEYQHQIAPYLRERENYVRFLEWENNQLLRIIHEEGLTLRNNLKEVIDLLAKLPINQYEFPALEPIEISDGQDKGA